MSYKLAFHPDALAEWRMLDTFPEKYSDQHNLKNHTYVPP